MHIRSLSLALALAGGTLLSACGQTTENPSAEDLSGETAQTASAQLRIAQPWSRETAVGQDAGGAFMTIVNKGDEPDRLVGGTTPVAGDVQIHTVDMTGGVMRMRQLGDGLEIPAGGSVALKPGGFHIMLMQLARPLKDGERVPITLEFAQAGKIEVQLDVRSIADGAPEGAAQ